ncbi:hypothetical protein CK203_001715 [Vitis vinifera]|uniref:Uncharacterized protein n=1 Tax=Vitis vinifera TaxID=29760 RepID=A0A438KIP4_VITVI|nr:hypothetical protein CK203_001715 [Vitis vinifera]
MLSKQHLLTFQRNIQNRSYHDGEHYNSVRLKEDPCDGPARPIIIKADTDLSVASHQVKGASSKSKSGAGRNIIDAGSIKLVMVGSGCENAEKVEQVLVELSGDVDAAIEYLIAERETEEDLVENDKLLCQTDTSYGNGRPSEVASGWGRDGALGLGENDDRKVEQGKEILENNSCKQDSSSNSIGQAHDDSSCRRDEKKIPRNQVCPCGSKKKCKTCCGSVAGRPSTKFLVYTS